MYSARSVSRSDFNIVRTSGYVLLTAGEPQPLCLRLTVNFSAGRALFACLPWDILYCIMQCLEHDDVSRFMRTCATLYEFGIPLLIKDPFHYDGGHTMPRIIASFCNFMLKTPHRCPLLRDLPIPDLWNDVECSRDLVLRVLTSACNLRTVRVQKLEKTLKTHNAFDAALRGLETLETVEFCAIGEQGLTMLREMRAPLKKVVLRFGPRDYLESYTVLEDSEDKVIQPALFLQNFRGTLEELHLHRPPYNTSFGALPNAVPAPPHTRSFPRDRKEPLRR